jgi:hypothetical protein
MALSESAVSELLEAFRTGDSAPGGHCNSLGRPGADRLGSRLAVMFARDDVVRLGGRRRLDFRSAATGRVAFSYRSSALDREARFFFDRSISRQSPFHPSRIVSAHSDPSRSSTNHVHGDFRHCLPFDAPERRRHRSERNGVMAALVSSSPANRRVARAICGWRALLAAP